MNKRELMTCLICGRKYAHLGSHVWHAHKVRAREYKRMFGLNYNHPLITDEIKRKKHEHWVANREKYMKNLKMTEEFKIKRGQRLRYYFSRESIRKAMENLKHLNIEGKLAGLCPFCGVRYQNVYVHLYMKHGYLLVNVRDYAKNIEKGGE